MPSQNPPNATWKFTTLCKRKELQVVRPKLWFLGVVVNNMDPFGPVPPCAAFKEDTVAGRNPAPL